MRNKFRTKNKRNLFKKLYILLFIYIIIGVFFNGKVINIKDLLLNSSLNYIISDKNYFLELLDINFKTPENILYISLNKFNDKEELFKKEDSINTYTENKSDYVTEVKENNLNSPIIYIYNTHQLEEYSLKLHNPYNIVPNVMIASYTLKEKLLDKNVNSYVEKNNIKTFLNQNNLTYDDSYYASRYYLLEAKEKYPSLVYFIDLHRDSARIENTLLDMGEKKYAKIMFVVGMDHENASKNLELSNKINEKMENRINGISRGIYKKESKSNLFVFNQDLSENIVLIELGGLDNEIEEVYNTIEVLAEVLSEVVKEG